MRITTSGGKLIHLIPSLSDLHNISSSSTSIRARCPIHQSDHQRSLSINRQSGWGSCFRCHALILVEEYNRAVANDLRRRYGPPNTVISPDFSHRPLTSQKEAIHTLGETASWQQQEVQALHLLHPWMQQAINNIEIGDVWQAQAYLAGRAIPLDLALQEGVGYLPRELLLSHPEFQCFQHLLNRWTERIIFPLRSPTGNGYIGRSIWRWQIGMNEDEHKGLLADEPDAPHRYIKTNPAGWFCAPPLDWSDCVALVEGPFDRLALVAAGMKPTDVHAIVGTALNVHWIPEHVIACILALNGDDTGIEAMEKISEELRTTKERMLVEIVTPPVHDDEGQKLVGKNWNARWTQHGPSGTSMLTNTFLHISEFFQPFSLQHPTE